MSLPVATGMGPDLTLSSGYVVRFKAGDPGDGSSVSGVKVSGVSLFVDVVSGQTADDLGPFMFVPGPSAD